MQVEDLGKEHGQFITTQKHSYFGQISSNIIPGVNCQSREWKHFRAHVTYNLPAMQETGIQSLGQEDPLEREVATHSSILAWRIPWMEEPGGLQSTGLQRVRHDCATNTL